MTRTANRHSTGGQGGVGELSLDHVAVIGGGRWARVLTEVVANVVPPATTISVHSRHNATAMASWAAAPERERGISVSSDWPTFVPGRAAAVIVVNAARDHEEAVDWAIAAGVPVLVEKPIALSAAGAERLVERARHEGMPLAPAHVFLFARYVERLAEVVARGGNVRAVRVCWTDPHQECRYGEQKRYDASVPVFTDVFPHVVSILSMFLPNLPDRCADVRVRRGGAQLEFDLVSGEIPCKVELARNSGQRRRTVEVEADTGTIVLDFSEEPGRIICGEMVVDADREWNTGPRPATRLVTAFLDWAAGGSADPRLAVRPALQSCRLVDEIHEKYRSRLIPWLARKLGTVAHVDEDLRYALSEVLQAEGLLPFDELERQIEGAVRHFFGHSVSTTLDTNSNMNALEVVRRVARGGSA